MQKKLGYEGYSELRFSLKRISEKIIEREERECKTDENNDPFEEISHEVNRTLMIQDREKIREVVNKILKSKIVYVVSRVSSIHAGEYLTSRLRICKIKTIFISDVNLLDTIIEHMTSEEVIIFLSQSGGRRK
ncbi:MurR/RpiR family transcriptional regulator [Leptotrichia sp. OH3620_COT-345]|uniref:MurR/RpiR family transcriptional regulator n=1 Tax=Leptotrichia sp. OH3620_COT-345 TaxID=2491048 RepID=UPI000F6502D6|nr:MurR/RpiR family transcriptional regulator [Leptotrichia sp. OH3620_COT-345]RRD40008.1 MurR/RpiR family transcriptional regulator [Leptotrichia sp. OH3620_COT-345]